MTTGTAPVAALSELSASECRSLRDTQARAYRELQARGLSLDLTRGKPSPAQLDLATPLLALPGEHGFADRSGADTRNYGGLAGLPELREIFAELLGIPAAQLVAGGNSSLSLMHDVLAYALLHGTPDSARPWVREDRISVLCPVPGYDRHFALAEHLGLTLIPVPLGPDGPDPDAVAAALAEDPSIRAMWVVPTYANPTGSIYTEQITEALVSMPAPPDFRILWDNAYALHHLSDRAHEPIDVLELAAAAGQPNRPVVFASTSKITFAGAGVSFLGASPANIEWYLGHLAKQSIGPDKINQLRHALFLRDAEGVRTLMRAHRDIIKPKFAAVVELLQQRLGPYAVARWTRPEGGYFVSLDVVPGTAARVVELAGQAGIAMTPAGSAFPYQRDPEDANIRIAPTFPDPSDITAAIDGLATCVLLAAAEARCAPGT